MMQTKFVICVDKLCHAANKFFHAAGKLCYAADKLCQMQARFAMQPKYLSKANPLATSGPLRRPQVLPWPGPDLNRQTFADKGFHPVDKVCHLVDCRRTGRHADKLPVCQQGSADKLCQQVLADKLCQQGSADKRCLHTQAPQAQKILVDTSLQTNVVCRTTAENSANADKNADKVCQR